MFEDAKIGIPCPKCSRKTEKTIAWIKANSRFTCSCGSEITLDSRELLKGLEGVDKSLADLKRSLR